MVGTLDQHHIARLVRESADTLVDSLLQAEPVLAGASTGVALGRLTEAVAAVHADLGTAVDGLAAGLERTAEVVLAVDLSLAGG